MSGESARLGEVRVARALVLCRRCIEYVFVGADRCPHCGEDARMPGPRYRACGYGVTEAIRRIEDLQAQATGPSLRGEDVSPAEEE
jgi:ribosomal protein L37E